MEESFTSIMENRHFNQFVSLLSVPFASWQWRDSHPHVAYWNLLEPLKKAVFVESALWPQYKQRAFDALISMLVALVEADARLHYSQEDMEWLVTVLDSNRAQVTLAMLLAASSSRSDYLTPVQASEATDRSESYWRNACAAGEVIGAKKAGKQWLIPVTALRAHGFNVEMSGQTVEVEEDE